MRIHYVIKNFVKVLGFGVMASDVMSVIGTGEPIKVADNLIEDMIVIDFNTYFSRKKLDLVELNLQSMGIKPCKNYSESNTQKKEGYTVKCRVTKISETEKLFNGWKIKILGYQSVARILVEANMLKQKDFDKKFKMEPPTLLSKTLLPLFLKEQKQTETCVQDEESEMQLRPNYLP